MIYNGITWDYVLFTCFNLCCSLMAKQGVPLETEYKPYTGVKGQCNNYTSGGGTVSSSVNIPAGFQAMESYLRTNGPFVGS